MRSEPRAQIVVPAAGCGAGVWHRRRRGRRDAVRSRRQRVPARRRRTERPARPRRIRGAQPAGGVV